MNDNAKRLVTLAKGAPLQIAIVVAVAVAILWFLSIRIGGYFYRTDIYEDDRLFNMTKAGVQWDVFYGHSPMCGSIECFATAGYPTENYQKRMILPAREFPLNDYVQGQKIYLRTTVEIPERILKPDVPVAFHSLYVWAKSYKLYINDTLLEEGSAEALNVTIPRDLIGADRRLNLSLVIDPGDLPYQGLANRRDLLIGSKATLQRTVFDAEELKTTFYLWFLIPKMIFCLLFSMVFLFLSRSKLLFMFIGYAFLCSVETFFDSAYAPMMLGQDVDLSMFGPLGRGIGLIFFVGFLLEYFGKGQVRSERFVRTASLTVIGLTTAIFYLGSQNAALRFLDLSYAFINPVIFLIAGFRARREKQIFLAVFFLLSLVPTLLQSWVSLSDFFGFNKHLGINFHWIHELVMFLILTCLAIIDLGKALLAKVLVENELKAVNERLELGRTVQSMLLPPSMSGSIGPFAYQFFYDPAEKLSGDWLNIWRSENQNHLFLGDVVGKGPQAALAVAAIASVINDSKFYRLSIAETIERINCQLIELFQKHITSTFSSVTFHGDGSIELHNAASLGWFALKGNKIQHLPMRSMPLGVVKNAKVATVRRTFEPGTTLFTFTDGVLEGSRALKNLFTKLRSMPEDAELTFDELHEMLLTLGKEHVLVDDKSILIVRTSDPKGQTIREFQAG